MWLQYRTVAVDQCTNTLWPYSVQTLRLIKVKQQNSSWSRWDKDDKKKTKNPRLPGSFAHPHTDLQAQICHLQYSLTLLHVRALRHMETQWCFDNIPSVIYRARIRLLPSFSDFFPSLGVSVHVSFLLQLYTHTHTHIFSQVIQITVLNVSRLTLASGSGTTHRAGGFPTQPPRFELKHIHSWKLKT